MSPFSQTNVRPVSRSARNPTVVVAPRLLNRAAMSSERGAILIQVAVLLLVLIAFLGFVADYGLLWVSRRQAQNAADAGALAGATARAFDEPGMAPDPNGPTVASLNAFVNAAPIAGRSGTESGRTWSFTCPAEWLPDGRCVRVNVFRNGEEDSPTLPVWFTMAVGLSNQGTRATATAIAAQANGSNCLKPWIIPDLWEEHQGSPDTFDPPGDIYTAPTEAGPGTGYTAEMFGTELVLKAGNPHQAISPSDFYEMEDATSYEEAITGCEITKKIGDTVTALPGNRVGPTNHGVDALTANGPVVVNIAMFSPAAFEAMRRQSGNFELVIVNMLAFEITGRTGNQITGKIIGGPGEIIPGGVPPGGIASMISKIMLVR